MKGLGDAATAYVHARRRLLHADPASMLEAAITVDSTWHDLHRAAGFEVFERCCDDALELEEVEQPTRRDHPSARTVKHRGGAL